MAEQPDSSFDWGEFNWRGNDFDPMGVKSLKQDIIRHIVSTLGNDYHRRDPHTYYLGLAYAVRDRLIDRWIRTQRAYYEHKAKRVYYLSLEYLPGRFLMNNLSCLGLVDVARKAMKEFDLDLEEIAEVETDAGLGNGGLGRLASCYLDSMASLGIPGYGYGIRYDYGIFHQAIQDGWQVEQPDHWLRTGTPWAVERGRYLFDIRFYGEVRQWTDDDGRLRYAWEGGNIVRALACDMPVPGYQNDNVINMRLWSARSDQEFNLDFFNTGDYLGAVHERISDENISKVLYPNEEVAQGKELRLKQQYFFVAATLMDILRRFKKRYKTFETLPERVAIQLNDTHPTIAIPEMMRILMDEELMGWDMAWNLCVQTFAYTNHTILPEALETWPESLLARVLPRHLAIIQEINRRFLEEMELLRPGDKDRLKRLSLIDDGPHPQVRMAHLAIVGSHTVNGVSALHGDILKESTFADFNEVYPQRLTHVTNGVTPRRFIKQCNPAQSELLDQALGKGWVRDLDRLGQLAEFADDTRFRAKWRKAKQTNKKNFSAHVKQLMGQAPVENGLFDVQIKRIHEYKRQLLNVLHAITLYNRISDGEDHVPRTVFFAGKAAPSYWMAKLIIRLISAVSRTVNNDPRMSGKLRIFFLPNYRVSLAERIIPATDLSQQISLAGMEASGTGNMKFAMNGALTIGTLDGANVEMAERIGAENMFIFGLGSDAVAKLRTGGYDPGSFLRDDQELARAVEQIASGRFSPGEPELFRPIADALTLHGDRYMVLADYRAYLDAQGLVEACWRDQEEWTRRSILNVAGMGFFSSDRAVAEYAARIWGSYPVG